jgi:hypothetical protein
VYNLAFTASDVTTRDYFHPSVAGQTKAAETAWRSGFDFTDQVAPVSTPVASGGFMSVTATDDVGVSAWSTGPPAVLGSAIPRPSHFAPGQSADVRAVDVNGNIEASHTLTG